MATTTSHQIAPILAVTDRLELLPDDESTYLPERLEKRGTRVDFIIDLIEGAYFFDNPEIQKILQFPLHGLKWKPDLVHDLSLVKALAGSPNEEGQNSCP
jgi:hypothetical protein